MERQIDKYKPGFLKKPGLLGMALILICFILAMPLSAQVKGKLDGTIYLANDQTVAMNAVIVKYLTDNIGRIASVGGKTTYLVPVAKEFKKRLRTRLVDGYMVQYAYVGTVNPAVSLQKPKTKYIEFDFKTKKIKEVSKNDDNDDPWKPSDTRLKDKVKEKDDKDKVSPGAKKP